MKYPGIQLKNGNEIPWDTFDTLAYMKSCNEIPWPTIEKWQ
jgi:hypothetical protein